VVIAKNCIAKVKRAQGGSKLISPLFKTISGVFCKKRILVQAEIAIIATGGCTAFLNWA
jgi:hypothetical protein